MGDRLVEARLSDSGKYNIYMSNDRNGKRKFYSDRGGSEITTIIEECVKIGYEDVTDYQSLGLNKLISTRKAEW